MQALADRQDTPVSWDSFPSGRFGVGWIVHVRPFQRSTRVSDLEFVMLLSPTAVHEVADEQDTPTSSLPSIPPVGGFRVGWIVHFEPFQCSASVLLPSLPTAVQARGDQHDTASSSTSAPGAAGRRWITHFLPFQRMASPWPGRSPTAIQARADEHHTPIRNPFLTRGRAWTAHVRPVQRSATGKVCPPLPPLAPTAKQVLTAGQDTPVRTVP